MFYHILKQQQKPYSLAKGVYILSADAWQTCMKIDANRQKIFKYTNMQVIL